MVYPETAKIGVVGSDLHIAYRCSLIKQNFWNVPTYAGEGRAIARFRLEDIFRFQHEVPAEISLDRSLFHSYAALPRLSDEHSNDRPCRYITSSDNVLHVTCGDTQGAASLYGAFDATYRRFSYRTLWGYALLPVVVPLGVAADIAASPLYAMLYISLKDFRLSSRGIETRSRAAKLIAYEW